VRYLPIFLDVRGQSCLLVGGGAVALRKARTLLSAGARLVVVAPQVDPALRSRLAEAGGTLRERVYAAEDLSGMRLVIAATDDAALNARVSGEAQALGLPVNVVDDPAHCSFVMPAVVDRDPVLIAVSTGGASPVLARTLRAKLETAIAPGYGRLAALLGRHRARVQAELPAEDRRAFWEAVLDGPIAERALAGDEAGAEALLVQQLGRGVAGCGEVLLVHAGPGAPDLLTLRALRQLERASHVLHGEDVTGAVLTLARRDALIELVPVERQLEAALDLARTGARVCVLRSGPGGDFSPVERQRLGDSGLAWLEVPGVPG